MTTEPEVRIVRDSVWFMARLSCSSKVMRVFSFFRFSRTRSYMTTVSLMEKPTMSSSAATMFSEASPLIMPRNASDMATS